MLSFKPDLKIQKSLKALQGAIAAVANILESVAPEEKQYLNRCALISNIGASTRIENAVLTDVEIEWVDTTLSQDGKPTAFEEKKEYILNKLSKDRERSVEEVIGCREVLSTLYQHTQVFSPLTETAIRGLHNELLKYYPPASRYAGNYKKVINRVISTNHKTGEERIVLEPTEPGMMTTIAMQELLEWYNEAIKEDPWPLLVAVEFVFRFLAIHPFQDGNGRLGRALFLLVLLQSSDKPLEEVVPYIAIDRHIEQNKSLYYSVLHQCSGGKFLKDPTAYHYDPLVWFFLKIFESAITDININRQRYVNISQLSETTLTVLNCFKSYPEKRLKVSEIEAVTVLPRRTIQYSLKILVDKQFIQNLGKGAGSRYQLVF